MAPYVSAMVNAADEPGVDNIAKVKQARLEHGF